MIVKANPTNVCYKTGAYIEWDGEFFPADIFAIDTTCVINYNTSQVRQTQERDVTHTLSISYPAYHNEYKGIIYCDILSLTEIEDEYD